VFDAPLWPSEDADDDNVYDERPWPSSVRDGLKAQTWSHHLHGNVLRDLPGRRSRQHRLLAPSFELAGSGFRRAGVGFSPSFPCFTLSLASFASSVPPVLVLS
jgi:hypothetical protein